MSVKVRMGFIGCCGVAALVLAACDGPTATPVASEALQGLQTDLVYYGMVSFLTNEGVRQGRVEADTAFVFNDSTNLQLRNMRIVFYDDDGRERARVVGDSGEMDQRSNRMVARGHVILTIQADGRRVESAELNYDPDRDRIWSDSATTLTYADGRVTKGSSFESDLEFKNLTVKNPTGAIGGIVF